MEVLVEHEDVTPWRIIAQFAFFSVMVGLACGHVQFPGRIEHPLGIPEVGQIKRQRQLSVEFPGSGRVVELKRCGLSLGGYPDLHVRQGKRRFVAPGGRRFRPLVSAESENETKRACGEDRQDMVHGGLPGVHDVKLGVFACRVRLSHGRHALDAAFVPDAGHGDGPFFSDSGQTAGENPEALDRAVHRESASGCGHDEVDVLVPDHGVNGADPVDERLHLAVEGPEIDRAGQDQNFRREQFAMDFGHVVRLDAGPFPADAGAAPRAVVDVPIRQADLFGLMTGVRRTPQEFVAEHVGVAPRSWTR